MTEHCSCILDNSKDILEKCSTAATLLIVPNKLAEYIEKRFVPTRESAALLYLNVDDIKTKTFQELLKNSGVVIGKTGVRFGYMLQKLINVGLLDRIHKLKNTHKILCQVELPDGIRYTNIDIGTTANGKYEAKDDTLIDCSRRELKEETGIDIEKDHYCPFFQQAKRLEHDLTDIPIYYTFGKACCYVLIL